MRMAANTVYEKGSNSDGVISLRKDTSSLSLSDKTVYKRSCREIFDFLMAPVPPHHSWWYPQNDTISPFWSQCMTVDTAVERALDAAGFEKQIEKGRHYTNGSISHDQRAGFIEEMGKHPVLGPLLTIAKSAMGY